MEAWYEQLAPLYGVEPGIFVTLTVEFAYRPPGSLSSEYRWSAHELRSLYAPSLHQILWAQSGEPSTEFYRTLAQFLAEALIADASGLGLYMPQGFSPEMWALRQELRDWALAPLDIPPAPVASSTPLVDALVAQHGPEVIATLTAGLDQWQTIDQGLGAAELELSDISRVFAFLLESQRRLSLAKDFRRFSQFVDPQASEAWLSGQRMAFQPSVEDDYWSGGGSAGSRITSVVLQGDMAWVEASQTVSVPVAGGLLQGTVGGEGASELPKSANVYKTLFFRRVDERWLHTSPDPAYFGAERVESGPNLTLRYLEQDAIWYEGSVERLQSVLEQVTTDLDIALTDQVFTVEVGAQPGSYGWPSMDDMSFTYHKFTSPHVIGWSDHPAGDPFADLAFSLARSLVASKLSPLPDWSDTTGWALIQAVSVWEYERLFPVQGGRAWSWWFSLRADPMEVAAQSLPDFVPVSVTSVRSESDANRVWISYQMLVKYLAEAYGPEVVPALLAHYEEIDDVDQWLRLATGDGIEQIEPAWQEWVLETYGQP
jgi:hypothetical protein